MAISINTVRNILNTLPVGYYAKRNIKCVLEEKGNTYYNIVTDEIHISYETLCKAFAHIENSNDIENDIRCLLYHEVSHALLTPTSFDNTEIRNIVEDERIETLFKDFYMNVNFKRFAIRVNNYKGEKPTSLMQAFYYLVRFRQCENQSFIFKLNILLFRYHDINSTTSDCSEYMAAIEEFYYDFVAWYKQNKSQSSQSQSSQSQSSQSQSSKSQSSESQSSESQSSDDSIYDKVNQNVQSLVVDNSSLLKIIFKNHLEDEQLNNKVFTILASIKKNDKRNGSAINAYSGVIDPHSVNRNDYKFFVQQNRAGHAKQFSKTHLNLFIDNSLSFKCNEDTVNKLLFALTKFEKQYEDFTYDIITMNTEIVEQQKGYTLKCKGCNKLPDEMFKIVKRHQLQNQYNINIVLFDGNAFSGYFTDERPNYYKNFGAFDIKNTVIISDFQNEPYIKTYCKSARKVFTRNYTDELYKHVFESLNSLTH